MGSAHLKQQISARNLVNNFSNTAHYFALQNDFKSHRGFTFDKVGTPCFEISTWRNYRNALWLGTQAATGNLMMDQQAASDYRQSNWNIDSNANGAIDGFISISGTAGTDYIQSITTNSPYPGYNVQNIRYQLATGNWGIWTNNNLFATTPTAFLTGKDITFSCDARFLTGVGVFSNTVMRTDLFTAANVFITGTQVDSPVYPLTTSGQYRTDWGLRAKVTANYPAAGTVIGADTVAKGRVGIIFRAGTSNAVGTTLQFCRMQLEEGGFITAFNPTTTGYGQSSIFTNEANHLVGDTEGTVAFWYNPGYNSSAVTSSQVSPHILQFGNYYTNTSLTLFANYYLQDNKISIHFKGPTNAAWDNSFHIDVPTLEYGKPMHVAVTYRAKSLIIYINGQIGYSCVLAEAINGWESNLLSIGPNGQGFYEDLVADRRAWTPEEINALYASAAQPTLVEEFRL